MKKIYYVVLAVSLMVVSCQKSIMEEDLSISQSAAEVVVGVGFYSESSESKLSVESDGMYGGSKYMWTSSDKLGGWSSDVTQTELNQYSTFTSVHTGDELEVADYTEFGGTASGNNLRLVYPYSDSEISGSLLPIDIETQDVNGEGSYANVGEYAVMISEKTYTLDRKYYVEDVMMQHVGALLDLHLQFASLESSGVTYTLSEVQISGLNSTGVLDLSSSGVSDALESVSSSFIRVNLTGFTNIENGKVYTVPVSILPTLVNSGSSILVKVIYADAEETYSVTTTVKNTASYSIDYCRAQRHYLEVSIDTSDQNDMDDLTGLGGFGSEGAPYEISSVSDLSILAESVAAGNNNSGVYFKLTKDINLGCSAINQWSAIGSSSNQFKGEFDGAGHTISGLYISNSSDDQGLFGYLGSGGVVKNLGVTGTVLADANVGGVVGHNYSGTVSGCYSSVVVSGDYYVGGIVGFNEYRTITNCYNIGKVSGSSTTTGGVGGIVGYNNYGTISNSYNIADISGSRTVGGVVGYNNYGTISNCYRLTGCVISSGTETTEGTSKSSSNMMISSFVTLLNASQSPAQWSADSSPYINSGYPILSWQEYQ